MNHSNFNPFPTLRTDRLTLRQLRGSDLQSIFALRSNKEVNQHIKRPAQSTIEEAEAFIERIDKGISENKLLFWVIVPNGESELIGSICLWNFQGEGTSGELGYDLMPERQGKGYMNESMAAVVGFGFEQMHLKKIEAFTHGDNLSSVKLLKRHGFVLEPDRKDEDDPENVVYSCEKRS